MLGDSRTNRKDTMARKRRKKSEQPVVSGGTLSVTAQLNQKLMPVERGE
jgi:hypothetical protein